MADDQERDERQGREGDEGQDDERDERDERDEGSSASDSDSDSDDSDGDDQSGRDEDSDGDGDSESDAEESEDSDEDQDEDEEEPGEAQQASPEEKQRIATARKNAEATRERHERADKEAEEREQARAESRRKRLRLVAILLGIVVFIVLIGLLISTCGGEAERKAGGDSAPIIGTNAVQQRYSGLTQEGFVLGQEDAPVRLVMFADLQCSLCKESVGNALPSLIDRYVKTGKARIEFQNYAILGPDSEKAARAAQFASEQGKAWQFIDLFYVNQRDENSGYVDDDFIRQIARGVPGLDAEATVEASNSAEQETLADAKTAAEKYGIDQAPSFLIGQADGQLEQLLIPDPKNAALFAQAIDRQIAEAEK